MSAIESLLTHFGQRLVGHVVPTFLKELARLNDNLELLNRALCRLAPQEPPAPAPEATEQP